MDWIKTFATNPFLLTGLSSWAYAQIIKTVIYSIINRKLALNRLFGDGGMPSGHSATVSSLATITGLLCGLRSYEFGISVILAIIVCHDAMGVRREAGRHAKVLNERLKDVVLKMEQAVNECIRLGLPIDVAAIKRQAYNIEH